MAKPARDARHWRTRGLQRLASAAEQARSLGAHCLVCPEMGLTGYAIGADAVQALAEPPDGPMAQAVAGIARQHGIAIVYGYPEHNPRSGQKPFNAVQAIDEQGHAIGHYRKTHLYGALDQQQFSPGDAPSQVFTCRGWRVGLLVCFDVEFPEAVRLLALQGADAVLVPTANMIAFDEVPERLVPARACENRMYVAYANACGCEGEVHYGGKSLVANALGDVVAHADRAETLLLATLNPNHLSEARRNSYLPHRRPDLYAALGAAQK
ncbi:MAG: carbon-nitrogen hydrolase family protein [Burkholderiaceae bacterium]